MPPALIVIVFLPVIALIIVAVVAAIVHLVRRNRDEPADSQPGSDTE